MNCPKCRFENPGEAKFCGKCGANLERICPNCSSPNPPQFKFCNECGSQLKAPHAPTPEDFSFDEKLTKIRSYLPEGLIGKILSQRDRIEGERKQVTVMFCDMEGFTSLSERLGPEKAYTLMDQVYEILIHKVHDYEGTVNEMTGDGIMALFGAPIALEDAPQRAIRSAYAIHREMTIFNDKKKRGKVAIPPLKMRIGIHTGPVVVGSLGNDLRVEFKAVGDTVNLASRIENIAEPGATYVSQETFRLAEGFFRFEALGEKKIKGKEGTIKIYRVIAPSHLRTRFDVSAEWGLTPFVGRERDLEHLLDGFERAKKGTGQAFSIMGEAGVGKSRLLYEFRKSIANEDVTFLEGKCLSYARGMAYHPIIDILKSNFKVRQNEKDLDVIEKVKKGLEVLGVEQGPILPYILELLSVKNSGIDRISMSPEARRDRIVEALKEIILKGSGIRPLVMAIEDLHWIDKSSEDALRSFLKSIPGARVLLTILMKTRKQIHQKIGTAIEELYRDKIYAHYETLINQFTASENYRKVADYSHLACKRAAESLSMHDAIDYARKWVIALEKLPHKEEFESEIIDARTALGFYLSRMSNMVEAKEAIDPIVDTVLKRGRKDRLGQIYLIIGCYKYMAEEDLPESIQYLEKAIETFKEIGDFETGLYASYMLGLVFSFNCDFEKAIPYFDMLLSLCMAVKMTWRVSVMKSNMSVYVYDYHGMVAMGYQTSEEAVQSAEENGDIYSKAMAYTSHGTSCYYKGLLEEAEKYLNIAINFTEKINIFAHNAIAHQWLGHVYFDLGKYQKAQNHFSKAIQVREHSRLAPSSANLNRIALMRARLLSGEKDINLRVMYRFVHENKVRIYEGCMARYIGDILLHLDEYNLAAAEDWIGKATEADNRNGMKCDLGMDYTLYGEFFKRKGQSSNAKEFLKKAIGIFKECGADGWARKTEKSLSEV